MPPAPHQARDPKPRGSAPFSHPESGPPLHHLQGAGPVHPAQAPQFRSATVWDQSHPVRRRSTVLPGMRADLGACRGPSSGSDESPGGGPLHKGLGSSPRGRVPCSYFWAGALCFVVAEALVRDYQCWFSLSRLATGGNGLLRSAGVPGVLPGPDCRSSVGSLHRKIVRWDLASPRWVPSTRRHASGKTFRWWSSPQRASLDLVWAAEQRHRTATLGANRRSTHLRSCAGPPASSSGGPGRPICCIMTGVSRSGECAVHGLSPAGSTRVAILIAGLVKLLGGSRRTAALAVAALLAASLTALPETVVWGLQSVQRQAG
ncbi:hypothetical protein NDU88_001304 [Pleurodeles waltl]|uniref:Uncharacterized protein n=1 Tax=Pleurodeles waltl TaxID=8319 RepID=A0AAV7VW20_PLEWA|nr:hypothetical protein NDU88_001304 [Pleurodeles waltl]